MDVLRPNRPHYEFPTHDTSFYANSLQLDCNESLCFPRSEDYVYGSSGFSHDSPPRNVFSNSPPRALVAVKEELEDNFWTPIEQAGEMDCVLLDSPLFDLPERPSSHIHSSTGFYPSSTITTATGLSISPSPFLRCMEQEYHRSLIVPKQELMETTSSTPAFALHSSFQFFGPLSAEPPTKRRMEAAEAVEAYSEMFQLPDVNVPFYRVLLPRFTSTRNDNEGRLLIANKAAILDVEWLRKQGVSCVFNCTRELADPESLSIAFESKRILRFHYPLLNDPTVSPHDYFANSSRELLQSLRAGHSVVLFCDVGLRRALSLAIAYLMRHEKYSLQACANLLDRLKTRAFLTPAQQKSLLDLQGIVTPPSEVSFLKPPSLILAAAKRNMELNRKARNRMAKQLAAASKSRVRPAWLEENSSANALDESLFGSMEERSMGNAKRTPPKQPAKFPGRCDVSEMLESTVQPAEVMKRDELKRRESPTKNGTRMASESCTFGDDWMAIPGTPMAARQRSGMKKMNSMKAKKAVATTTGGKRSPGVLLHKARCKLSGLHMENLRKELLVLPGSPLLHRNLGSLWPAHEELIPNLAAVVWVALDQKVVQD